ncbi:MAG: Bax inhibitor-1/YccA family protein [Bacteroidales bacterium]|nr:Bax inhibitor-1/YccA family protein [Bacteroidales bacterium]
MFTQRNINQTVQTTVETKDLAKNFIANVFAWMGIALAISAFTAFYFATNENLMFSLINPDTGGMTILGWIVMLSPFGFVLAMSMGFQKFSANTLILLFGAFSILMGASLSFILLTYTSASVFKTFVVTAGMFGIMSFVGYTTKTDLTKFGSLMFMGLIGIIIASVINMFMQSGTFDYIISFIGVLVFTGLTAYDVQKLKRIGAGIQYGSEPAKKLVIMGALSLYLDFINLFLFLLRFLGNRR